MPSNSLGVLSHAPPNVEALRHQRGLTVVEVPHPEPPPSSAAAAEDAARYDADCVLEQRVPRVTLTAWNLAMFAFHSALTFVTLYVGNLDLEVPVYRTELLFNETIVANSSVKPWKLIPTYEEDGSIFFTWATASFFALSALFHLLNATLLRAYYLRSLAHCLTPTRYLEYTFSAAVMQVLIAYTLGVRERMLLVASGLLIGVTMPFGYWCEQLARPSGPDCWTTSLRHRLFPWIVGHAPLVGGWAIIIVNFYDDDDNRAPDFVHVILWGELALFLSFGLVVLYQQCGTPRNFYKGELAFQVLSLGAKGLLGGLLIGNVLMLSEFDELYE